MNEGFFKRLGSGKQILPWIHVEDAVNAIEHCIMKRGEAGIYNIVSNEQRKNEDWVNVFKKQRSWPPFQFPNPEFMVRRSFGDISSLMLEQEIPIIPSHLNKTGFKFKYNTLEEAFGQVIPTRDQRLKEVMEAAKLARPRRGVPVQKEQEKEKTVTKESQQEKNVSKK